MEKLGVKAAEMVGSAVVQDLVSRAISYVFDKLAKVSHSHSQEHMMERLKMAVYDLGAVLERTAKLPIGVSRLPTREMIVSDYLKGRQLLDRHEEPRGVKRKRWGITVRDNNSSPISSSAILTMDQVLRIEGIVDWARKFAGDVESDWALWGQGLFHPREGKTFKFRLERGRELCEINIRSWCSAERGVEAMLDYHYRDSSRVMEGECFYMKLILRLSEKPEVVGVATKCLQLLESQFKLPTEFAKEKLTRLGELLKHKDHPYSPSWIVNGNEYSYDFIVARNYRREPACCEVRRHGFRSSSNVSSELSHIFPEEVNLFGYAYFIPASRTLRSTSWTSPLKVIVLFMPHYTRREVVEERGEEASIQQVLSKTQTLKSDAIGFFQRQPEFTEYKINWETRHGCAQIGVKRPIITETTR